MPRFARPPGPYGTEVVAAITLTGGAAHTKGSWTDLDASVSRDVMGFFLNPNAAVGASGTDTSILIDIGIGNTGNAVDATLIANIPIGYGTIRSRVYFPLAVRKGERLAARIQGTQASETYPTDLALMFAPPPPFWGGFSKGENITPMTLASSSPTMADFTDNAYEEIVASTSQFYRAFNWWPAIVTNAGVAHEHAVELGVGPAGSEQVIGRWANRQTAAEVLEGHAGPLWVEHPVPAGSRLAVKKVGTGNLTGAFAGYW